MARTVKQEEYTARRKEILDAAQRLVYTVGYDHLSIQDILDQLQISKGAFYHYFDSKQDLLEALIEYLYEEFEPIILPVVEDPDLSTLDKLHRFFDTANRWKTARKAQMMSLLSVYYADENAIVRQKSLAMAVKRAAPLLGRVIAQGVQEGVLATRFPERTGEIVFSMFTNIGNAMIDLLMHAEQTGEWAQDLERALDLAAAYNDAIERVLGAPAGSLKLMTAEMLQGWFTPEETPVAEPDTTRVAL